MLFATSPGLDQPFHNIAATCLPSPPRRLASCIISGSGSPSYLPFIVPISTYAVRFHSPSLSRLVPACIYIWPWRLTQVLGVRLPSCPLHSCAIPSCTALLYLSSSSVSLSSVRSHKLKRAPTRLATKLMSVHKSHRRKGCKRHFTGPPRATECLALNVIVTTVPPLGLSSMGSKRIIIIVLQSFQDPIQKGVGVPSPLAFCGSSLRRSNQRTPRERERRRL
ncbi:hypothetical protein F5148DRAFT_278027 [Russula earlei]|uniref:Uncharacterized protein n=1 Tax=Russula earlei TaxID=71964 RepID=A0ACC0UNU7_9AGAM|nr:hypothetical protein F5148DRAFT_278027 [Russula earlei]